MADNPHKTAEERDAQIMHHRFVSVMLSTELEERSREAAERRKAKAIAKASPK
jgi:hypothetical protein